MKTIAVIDDDIYIGDMIEEVLRKENYNVLRARSGTEALSLLSKHSPDLVLLDLMMPGLSGEEVLPHIENIPTIVVSAKSDVDSKVNLLLSGAADYLTKPFDTKELLARIAVQLRNSENSSLDTFLKCSGLTLNLATREVSSGDDVLRLTRTEFAIMKLLMQNPNRVIAKSTILDRICIDTPDCTESSLKVHISNMRSKFRKNFGEEYIEAIWGIGFKMNDLPISTN